MLSCPFDRPDCRPTVGRRPLCCCDFADRGRSLPHARGLSSRQAQECWAGSVPRNVGVFVRSRREFLRPSWNDSLPAAFCRTLDLGLKGCSGQKAQKKQGENTIMRIMRCGFAVLAAAVSAPAITKLCDRNYATFGILSENLFCGPGFTYDVATAGVEQFRSRGAPRGIVCATPSTKRSNRGRQPTRTELRARLSYKAECGSGRCPPH
jgi:hypothetical protein